MLPGMLPNMPMTPRQTVGLIFCLIGLAFIVASPFFLGQTLTIVMFGITVTKATTFVLLAAGAFDFIIGALLTLT